MKILKKIIAYFNFKGEKQQMELSGAEVRSKGVFLHPVDDPKHVFFVKSNSVDIIINNDEELSEEDVSVIDKEIIQKCNREGGETSSVLSGEQSATRPLSKAKYISSKKRFSIMLYQDEYDNLMQNIAQNGYKRAEFFLACVHSAKKQSFDSIYKKYTDEHKKRYKSDLTKVKKMQPNKAQSTK